MTKVFISYSTVNRDFADYVSQRLRVQNIEVFIDYLKIEGGDNFYSRLGGEIDKCDFLILILSLDSIKSKWVHAEVSWAFQKNKKIIPLSLDYDINLPNELFVINNLHRINFTGWNEKINIENGISALLKIIGANISLENSTQNTSLAGLLTSGTIAAATIFWNIQTKKIQEQTKPIAQPVPIELLDKNVSGMPKLGSDIISPDSLDRLQEIAKFSDHMGKITAVALSPNNQYLATGTGGLSFFDDLASIFGKGKPENTTRVWDIKAQKLIKKITYGSTVSKILFSSDNHILFSRVGGCFELVDLLNGTETPSRLAGLELSPNGQLVASCDTKLLDGATISVTKLEDRKLLWQVKENIAGLANISFSPNSKLLLVAGDNRVAMFDVRNGQLMWRFEAKYFTGFHDFNNNRITNPLEEARFSPDNTHILTKTSYHLEYWNIITKRRTKTVSNLDSSGGFDLSPDEQLVAYSDGSTLLFKDSVNDKILRKLKGHSGKIVSVVFSLDGTLLATGSYDKSVIIWGLRS